MTRRLQLAAVIALLLGATHPLMAGVLCKPTSTLPFTAGPTSDMTGFPGYVTDSEGIGLQLCIDPATANGPNLCFYDPIIAGNWLSEQTGFGAEGFFYLAESNFTTAEMPQVLVVMAAEATYLAGVPIQDQQLMFTRLRIRVDVTKPGIYRVDHPYGWKSYTVQSVVDAKGRAIKREINDTVDVAFNPRSNNVGVVGPWLRWDASPPAAPAGYLGDGPNTPHTVVGSPCGQNFVRITATALDGKTPLVIDTADSDRDGRTDSVTSRLFTVQGKLAGKTITPLSVERAYYSRQSGNVDLHVFASAPTTAAVSVTPNGGTAFRLDSEATGRFYASSRVSSTSNVPSSVSVTATNGTTSPENTLDGIPVTDLVTITQAEARCDPFGVCSVQVKAKSSDRDSSDPLTLYLGSRNTSFGADGVAQVDNLTALPASVVVTSSRKGSASKPLTVINQ